MKEAPGDATEEYRTKRTLSGGADDHEVGTPLPSGSHDLRMRLAYADLPLHAPPFRG